MSRLTDEQRRILRVLRREPQGLYVGAIVLYADVGTQRVATVLRQLANRAMVRRGPGTETWFITAPGETELRREGETV